MSIFSKTPRQKLKKNVFNLTHDRKLSCKFGELIPTMVMDVVPGDRITLDIAAMIRTAPLVAPVMHRANVYFHAYYVPNRILWDGWEDFITGGEDGMDNTVWPYLTQTSWSASTKGSLSDHLGLPIVDDIVGGNNEPRLVSALPFAAYQRIWHEYYRDQNLQPESLFPRIDLQDGNQTGTPATNLKIKRLRAWQHDYFTSALPWTQKGPEAMLPLGASAPLYVDFDGDQDTPILNADGTASQLGAGVSLGIGNNGELASVGGATVQNADVTGYTFADLSQATASSINDLRRAFKLQEWLEKNARGGSRYTESISVHFGEDVGDYRLQRPEYLGGTANPIKISEVLQTAQQFTDAGEAVGTPTGTMSGHAVSYGSSGKISCKVKEHGYIMVIMSVMPESAYQQGIPKHFLRMDKFDYFWPEFAHIGEQPIYNDELVVDIDDEQNAGVFGYTPRYAEYKYMSNTVHGDFKDTLNFWHMGRRFTNVPSLDAPFIQMQNAEVTRIFAVEDPSYDHLYCHILNQVTAVRPMPVFGIPKIA